MPTYNSTQLPLRYMRRLSQISCTSCSSQESEEFPQLITLIPGELCYSSEEDDASGAGTPIPDSPIATDACRHPGNLSMLWAPIPVDHDLLLAAVVRRPQAFSGDRPRSSLDLLSPNDATPSSPSSVVDPFAFIALRDAAAYDDLLSSAARDDAAGGVREGAHHFSPILKNLNIRSSASLTHFQDDHACSALREDYRNTSAPSNSSPSIPPEDLPCGLPRNTREEEERESVLEIVVVLRGMVTPGGRSTLERCEV
ncbi:hypothetical protein T484DRAFT_1855520 [Baffinella frigidus]|nr:hypothetical protein T484DRAFT_1855520 [Cryptophyta sp. CCMP2293]